MAGLKTLVAVMSVALIAGFAALAYVLYTRLAVPEKPRNLELAVPEGSHVVDMTGVGDRLVLRLARQDGQPERLIVVDLMHGRAAETLTLLPR